MAKRGTNDKENVGDDQESDSILNKRKKFVGYSNSLTGCGSVNADIRRVEIYGSPNFSMKKQQDHGFDCAKVQS